MHNDAKIEKHQTELIKAIERIKNWAPVHIEQDKVFLSETFLEHVNNFLHEQTTHIGGKLLSAGWD